MPNKYGRLYVSLVVIKKSSLFQPYITTLLETTRSVQGGHDAPGEGGEQYSSLTHFKLAHQGVQTKGWLLPWGVCACLRTRLPCQRPEPGTDARHPASPLTSHPLSSQTAPGVHRRHFRKVHNLIAAFQKPDQGIITPLQHPVVNHAKAKYPPGTGGAEGASAAAEQSPPQWRGWRS